MQPKRVIDCMPRFVTQDAHAFDVGAAFDFAHKLPFEFHQPRMREIKRNGKTGNAVRREPFGRQPHMRLVTNAAIIQLAVKTFDMRFDE